MTPTDQHTELTAEIERLLARTDKAWLCANLYTRAEWIVAVAHRDIERRDALTVRASLNESGDSIAVKPFEAAARTGLEIDLAARVQILEAKLAEARENSVKDVKYLLDGQDAIRAENARLREALEKIAAPIVWAKRYDGPSAQTIARAALQGEKEFSCGQSASLWAQAIMSGEYGG